MGWRPKDWPLRQPVAQAMEYIPERGIGTARILTPSELALFEAGADAMLQALKKHGLKVNNVAPEHKGKGIIVFIPDEEEVCQKNHQS